MDDAERRTLRPGDVVQMSGRGEAMVVSKPFEEAITECWLIKLAGYLVAVPLSQVAELLYRPPTREEWEALVKERDALRGLLKEFHDRHDSDNCREEHGVENSHYCSVHDEEWPCLIGRIRAALGETP